MRGGEASRPRPRSQQGAALRFEPGEPDHKLANARRARRLMEQSTYWSCFPFTDAARSIGRGANPRAAVLTRHRTGVCVRFPWRGQEGRKMHRSTASQAPSARPGRPGCGETGHFVLLHQKHIASRKPTQSGFGRRTRYTRPGICPGWPRVFPGRPRWPRRDRCPFPP